ncbi:MAG: efflux RND transporter permease subunit [Candidatus Delongbacteria bacterium]|nr:efflux RND transporter permease subunit [Candidatus Delongbacteria bacterium]
MILVKTAVKRPVLTTVTVFAIALLGFLSYFNLPLNTIPEVEIPFVTIQVVYPGASPEEIETNITKKIEDEVYTVSGLDYVESYLMENVSITVCKFLTDKDPDIANQEVKDKIDAILNEFPDGVYKPVIMKLDINAEAVVQMAFVTNLSDKDAYDFVENELKKSFAKISGVSKVETAGGRKREIQIVLNNKNLSKYSLSPLQVIGYLGMNNLNLPGGNISKDGSEYSVKVYGEFNGITEIENIKIQTPFGVKYLRDIAEIKDTLEKETSYSAYYKYDDNGNTTNRVIKISVFKQSDANTVSVADGVIEELETLNKQLPGNSDLVVIRDSSTFIRNSVADTMSTIYLGILLTAIVLYIFLHSLRITLIIAISLPVILISTFLLADISGFSLNVLTLMALSVSVGTLVTNSVVIIENIIRHMKMGESSAGASYKATTEIAVAVLASTLTNIVVFVPIASMGSIAGQMFKEFGLMVTYAMIFSIIVGFTVTPMLATVLLRKFKVISVSKKGFGHNFDMMFDRLKEKYRSFLSILVHHRSMRITTMVLPFLLLFGTFYYLTKSPLGSEFFPQMKDRIIDVSVEMPSYYEIDKTKSVFEQIRKKILELKETENVILEIGSSSSGVSQGGYLGSLRANLFTDKYLERSVDEVIAELNAKLLNIPDAKIKVSPGSSFEGGPNEESPIVFEIYGDDQEVLSGLTYQVLDIVRKVPGTTNVDTDIRPGKPEVRIIPDKKKLVEYGTDVVSIAQVVRTAVEGLTGSVLKESGIEYDIRVTLDDETVNDLDKIGNLTVLTPRGQIKISELADLSISESPSVITRKEKARRFKVTADVASRSTGEINSDILKEIESSIDIPEGYKIDTGFGAKMQAEMGAEFAKAALIAIILTFLLMAGILESYRESILIMMTLPLSLLGVLWGLKLTGISMSLFAMMAGVMLIGIVVNNAILILDYANILKKQGQTVSEAIINAATEKLKAVVMATLASVFGMLPLALGIGEGAAMQQGMGVVSLFGLITAALLTQFVIPSFYATFASNKRSIEEDIASDLKKEHINGDR